MRKGPNMLFIVTKQVKKMETRARTTHATVPHARKLHGSLRACKFLVIFMSFIFSCFLPCSRSGGKRSSIPVTHQGASRKFRIRFFRRPDGEGRPSATKDDDDASAAAQQCARHLSSYFTIYDADRQGHVGVARAEDADQLPPCQVSLRDIGRAALKHRAKWPAGNH